MEPIQLPVNSPMCPFHAERCVRSVEESDDDARILWSCPVDECDYAWTQRRPRRPSNPGAAS